MQLKKDFEKDIKTQMSVKEFSRDSAGYQHYLNKSREQRSGRKNGGGKRRGRKPEGLRRQLAA